MGAIKIATVGLFKFVRFTALCSLVGLCIYTLSNLAILEFNYCEKYENAYNQMLREHDRQLLAGNMIRSQQSWEKSADLIGVAYQQERADRVFKERQLVVTQHEIYAFMKMLDKMYPGAQEDVTRQLGKPVFALRPEVLPGEDEYDCGDDGTCPIIKLVSPGN